MKNPNPSSCPKCGASIPENAPQGLCPKCVLADAATLLDRPKSPSGRIPPPTVAELAPHFPELEILELIGAGGMGAVYKARQPKLDRLVALKILSHDLAADPAFTERFNREARVLARLNHPNIVTVFDFGTQGPFCFLLMEFMDGVNLRQAMRTGGFSPTETLVLVQDVCAALKFAHEKGILHRDIKPENILIDASGRVKIADFGIAKIVGENDRENVTLTQQGSVLGSPRYMAPEQFESPGDVDQRADIYSLGVVLYEMLTGELPIGRFAAPSTKSAMDARIDAIVMRTLEKERELRFQTIGEVKTRMENVTQTPGVGTTESVGARRTEAPSAAPTRSTARFANAAFIWTAVSLLTGAIFLPRLLDASVNLGPSGGIFQFVVPVGFLLLVVGLPALLGNRFGVKALNEIRDCKDQRRGLSRAMFGALAWPVICISAAIHGLTSRTMAAFEAGNLSDVLPVEIYVFAGGLAAWFLSRKVRGWARDGRPLNLIWRGIGIGVTTAIAFWIAIPFIASAVRSRSGETASGLERIYKDNAAALDHVGKLKAALALEKSDRNRALAVCAENAARAGFAKVADVASGSNTDKDLQSSTRYKCSMMLANSGHAAEATAIAEKITDKGLRWQALMKISRNELDK